MSFQFPALREEIVIETGFMKHTETLTLSTHNSSGVVVWTGLSRLGKTTTALWMKDRIDKAYSDALPNAFRARHFEVTQLDDWGPVQKRAMKALHGGCLGPLDAGLYKRLDAQELVEHVATGLIRERIGLIFIDEAGLWCLNAIRGVIAIRDQVQKMGHRVTIVLIGMDDLPIKLRASAQVNGRIHEWVYFQPHSLEETTRLVAATSDLWKDADPGSVEVKRQMAVIHEVTDGAPGLIRPLVEKVEANLARRDRELSAEFVMAVHRRSQKAMTNSQNAAEAGFAFAKPAAANGTSPKSVTRGRKGKNGRKKP